MTLPDGSPLLVGGALGSGRAAVWASTCDRDWGDLPVHPVFVPFARGLVDYLGGRAKGTVASFLEVGEPLEIRPAGGREESVRGRTPGGEEMLIRLQAAQALPGAQGQPGPRALQGRFENTDRAGFYQVLFDEELPQVVAVNSPASQGELEPMSAAALGERLPGFRLAFSAIQAGQGNPARSVEGRIDLGPFLLLFLAGLLLLEGMVADRS